MHASPGEEVERKPLAYHVQTSELPLGLPPELIGWDSFLSLCQSQLVPGGGVQPLSLTDLDLSPTLPVLAA